MITMAEYTFRRYYLELLLGSICIYQLSFLN